MNKRHVVIALGLGLLLASQGVLAGSGPVQTRPTAHATLEHQVNRLHQQVDASKAKTQKLQQKVDALQKQQQAEQKRLAQADAAIAQLRKQLAQLAAKPSGH